MKKFTIRFVGNILFCSLSIICKPLIAATPEEKARTGNTPYKTTDVTVPARDDSPYKATDVTTPTRNDTITPQKTPAEVTTPKSGQEVIPSKTSSMPNQNQSKAQQQNNNPSSTSPSTASLAYPTDVTPTGTPDTRPPPPARPAASSSTPAEYKPGATNPPPSNMEQPRPPAYIPQNSDQRPINERPEDKDKDQFQRQFD